MIGRSERQICEGVSLGPVWCVSNATDESTGSTFMLCSDTLKAIGGNYVLNSGTFIGPSEYMRQQFELITSEVEARWHCRRAHGSDQAMHNYLVYTGKVAEAGETRHKLDTISILAIIAWALCPTWGLYWRIVFEWRICLQSANRCSRYTSGDVTDRQFPHNT